MFGTPWTQEDDRRLLLLTRRGSVADAAEEIGRSASACYQRLARLGRGVCRTPEMMRRRWRRLYSGAHHSRATEFKPGRPPWNKGVNGLHLSPATEFKPGTLRGMAARRLCRVGWVTMRCHRGVRARWIKITNAGRSQCNWMPLARWIWIGRCGPIPKGRLIIHVDGDSLNDRPENLAMVNRSGHLRRQLLRDPSMRERRKAASAAASRERWKCRRLVQSGLAALDAADENGE